MQKIEMKQFSMASVPRIESRIYRGLGTFSLSLQPYEVYVLDKTWV